MKVLFVVLLSAFARGADPKLRDQSNDSEVVCGVGDNETSEYRKAIDDFTVKLYKSIAGHTQGHFVLSIISIWQSMAAIAEGADGLARQQLFEALGLPEDECARQSFYQLAANREPSGPDVSLARTRIFFVDEGLEVNNDWQNTALNQFNLITFPVPLKRAPQEAAFSIRNTIFSQIATLNFQGNSVLADSLDYNGLWFEAFPEAGVSRSPFYDHEGHQIGFVDMMTTRRRVRVAFIDQLNAKAMEIPVGYNGRYRMIFAIPVEGNIEKSLENVTNTVLSEIFDGLEETEVPIDVAVPQFLMSTECDVRTLLKELGVNEVWTDASATGNISQPAAVPSSFIQRVQVTLDSHGVEPHVPDFSDTGLDSKGQAITLDRPFMYGLFDVETYTCLFGAAYSIPTYGLHD